MLTKLFETPGLTIIYDEDINYLSLKWNGFVESDEFREAGKEIIKAISKTKAKRILSDNTDWKMSSPNDHGWAAYSWFSCSRSGGNKETGNRS